MKPEWKIILLKNTNVVYREITGNKIKLILIGII